MMEPVLLQAVPYPYNALAVVVLLQVGLILLVTGRRFLKWVSVVVVALVGSAVGGSLGVYLYPSIAWVFTLAGLVGGALLGRLFRPLGVGLVLAYLGAILATEFVSMPFVQYVVALDLLAYGLFLTDLAPTLVSSMLGSAILLLAFVWAGVSAPAALVLASAGGAARLMASVLPSRLALRPHQTAPMAA